MPSISEPERKGSTPSPADSNCTQCNHHKVSHISPARKGCVALIPGLHGRLTECRCGTYVPPIVVVEHPDDECQCGHKRSEHAATKGPLGTLPCRAEDENFNYVDNCTNFKLHKTALQALASRVHVGDAADVIDLITRLKSSGRTGVNEHCTCGHAALVHTGGTGNCLAHGYGEQDDSHCLEFHAQKLYCGECGHPHHLHDDYKQCTMPDCTCGTEVRARVVAKMVERARTEHPETDCTCGDDGVHTYGSVKCLVFWANAANEPDDDEDSQHEVAVESYGEPEDRDMWFPAAPNVEATSEPAPPAQTGVPAYRVVYVTDDDAYYAIDVPYGVNASVIDGQLRLWHAGNRIVGITANITSIQEHSQT